jgi:hypothetical protein
VATEPPGKRSLAERYEAMLARPGTPAEKFGHMIVFHMDEGTRPANSPQQRVQWTTKELSGELGVTPNSIGNLRSGAKVPPYLQKIEVAFLGKPGTDTPGHPQWREDLRDRHKAARNFNLSRRPARTKRQTSFPSKIVKRDPILHWRFADMDTRRNSYLDEERKPVDFYVSVGAFKNAGSQITLRMKERPGASLKIKSVTLVRLHPELVERLTNAQLLDRDFEQILQSRIASFVADLGKDPRDIPVFVRLWNAMPGFHGYLFGKRRFTNQWGFENGKLHVDIPLMEYPSPDWDDETEEAILKMSTCELEAKYVRGKKVDP